MNRFVIGLVAAFGGVAPTLFGTALALGKRTKLLPEILTPEGCQHFSRLRLTTIDSATRSKTDLRIPELTRVYAQEKASPDLSLWTSRKIKFVAFENDTNAPVSLVFNIPSSAPRILSFPGVNRTVDVPPTACSFHIQVGSVSSDNQSMPAQGDIVLSYDLTIKKSDWFGFLYAIGAKSAKPTIFRSAQ